MNGLIYIIVTFKQDAVKIDTSTNSINDVVNYNSQICGINMCVHYFTIDVNYIDKINNYIQQKLYVYKIPGPDNMYKIEYYNLYITEITRMCKILIRKPVTLIHYAYNDEFMLWYPIL